MNTSSRKNVFVPCVYWLLILLAGYLLMEYRSGNGSGDGTGNGGQGAVQAAGTGASDNENSEGNAAEGPSDTAAPAEAPSPHAATPDAASPDSQKHPAGTEKNKADAADANQEKADDGEPKVEQTPEDITPTLAQEAQKQSSEKSKVISIEEAKTGFFGVKVPGGERAVFLLDVSGSMFAPTADGISRLELMKRIFVAELTRVHQEIKNDPSRPKAGSFIFFSFSDDLQRFPPKGSFSYKFDRDINEAIKQINMIDTNAGGGTSMQAAFNQLQNVLKKEFPCDMLYFLSDGEPTDCQPAGLLDWLKKNMPRQKISTFAFATNSALLKDIANQHRGKHRQIR